jgi:hypothetical protein
MEDLGKKIKIEIEDKTIEFILLKELEYKKEKYVLVMDSEEDECGCDDKCEGECENHHEDECGCCNEKTIYIFKVDKNKKYSFIEDEKELDEVIKHLDKTFYED